MSSATMVSVLGFLDWGLTMSKHTPGPWFRDQYGHVYGTNPERPLADFLGGTVIDHPVICTPKNSKDTNLITAAPELLDALLRVMRHIPDNAGGASLSDDMHRAKKAIAKATGE